VGVVGGVRGVPQAMSQLWDELLRVRGEAGGERIEDRR